MSKQRLTVPFFAIVVSTGSACYQFPAETAVQREPVTRSTHDPKFPINSGAHGGADCNLCHGQFDTFTLFSCVNCHQHDQATMDALHLGVEAYTFSETSCYQCHPQAEGISRQNHGIYFPIAAGNHAGVACADCHLDGYLDATCFGCHTHECADVTPTHSTIAGFACDDGLCLECHPQGEAMSRGDHGSYFPIVTGNHASIACADCHTDGYGPGGTTCFGCHTHDCTDETPSHSAIAGFNCDDATCLGCHPEGTTMSRAQHATYFPITSGNHAAVACADCHVDGFAAGGYTCFGCHSHTCSAVSPWHDEVGGFSCADSACYNCHRSGYASGD